MSEKQDQANSFGDWLRRQRKARDWTQTDLAQRVGCAVDTIKKIETALARPSKQLAMRIATVLGIPPEEQEAVVRAARDVPIVDRSRHPLQPVRREPDVKTLLPHCHQLRSPLSDFVGQHSTIATLLTSLRQATHDGSVAAISGVRGMGGIGKTELALLVANRLTDTFPDAQILLNLRGASATPLLPEQALHQVIHAFSPELKLPDELEAAQGHYHSLLHGKRALIIADDARDAAQVRPLLPPKGCALLITSRLRFSLPGMTSIDLEVLAEAEAVRLLCSLCSRLNEADARRLAQACGCLPLALRVSGSLLHNDPALSVVTYLRQLADERQRLHHLRDPNDPQLDVETTLMLSYARLEPEVQQVFRQLGVLVADFTSELAQAVVEIPAQIDIEATLHTLLRHNLVIYDTKRLRWRLHDLVRDLARQELEVTNEAEAAQWRYARATVALVEQIQEQYLTGGEKALLALTQFDTERAHVDAARHWAQLQAHTEAGDQLLIDAALALRRVQYLRYDQRQDIIPLWEHVRTATRRLGNRLEEARALNNLGVAYYNLGELQSAISYFEQRLTIVREIGDRRGEGAALANLGNAYYNLGKLHMAINYHEQYLVIARETGDSHGEGYALGNLGNAYADLGELNTAISYYEQSLISDRDMGDRHGESATLSNMGSVYTDLSDIRRAIACCEEALSIARAIGDRRREGYALSYLAPAQALQGDTARASTTYSQALTLFQEVGDRWGEAECHWLFGLALARYGARDQALPLLRTALAYEQEIGHAKVAEHTTLLARLEAGEEPLSEPPGQQAIKDNQASLG